MTAPLCRLYLITPPRLDDLAGFGHALARALDAGDVASLNAGATALDFRGKGALPVAETAALELISLPMFPHMTADQVSRVGHAVREAVTAEAAQLA